MRAAELLLLGVAGWCGIGAAGVVISLLRGRRAEAAKHTAWIAAVAGAYLLLVLGVSITQRQKVVSIGRAQCYDTMCFTVTGVDEVPGLVAGDADRVVRVTVQVNNRGRSAEADGTVTAYLVDSRGRIWQPLPGLSGNRLMARLAGGSQMVSRPMFRVANDAAGLGLVFTHGSWQMRRLIAGDSDSLGHRRSVVALGM